MRTAARMLGIVLGLAALTQTAPPSSAAGGGGALGPDSTADDILKALEVRGTGLKDLTATVSHETMDQLSGTSNTLKGKFSMQYIAPGDARMRTLFDAKKIEQRSVPNFKREYLLAKGDLIERDYQQKTEVTRTILKPGQKMDPFKLGEGPFPLPIGQDPREVKRLFDVGKVAARQDDPPSTVHLTLTPKDNTEFRRKFKTVDVWVDTALNFPKRVRTLDAEESNRTTTDFTDIKLNPGLADKDFTLEKVQGWLQRVEKD